MMEKNASAPRAPKTEKRSVLGLLFNPQLGPAFSPLRETTNVFVHLLAAVFAIYGLFPKDHPSLKDQSIKLTLPQVIATGWQRVGFTREGLPKALIFFAVVGMMAVSAFVVVMSLLSMFAGHAHAQNVCSNASCFTPSSSNDLAQHWLDYLFLTNPSGTGTAPNYGTLTGMDDPFSGSVSLQAALMGALAMYSDAILIVAALVLFYHLASMIVETAHSGVPMGKRASQVWAPIRLVFAIGLLVPVNGGLSTGQFIVIKVAQMGSGLASNTWALFLKELANYAGKAVPPPAPQTQKIATDMIRMQVCVASWNFHVGQLTPGMPPLTNAKIPPTPAQVTVSGGTNTGTKYSYKSAAIGDNDICGSYFEPDGKIGANQSNIQSTLFASAAQANKTALDRMSSDFEAVATKFMAVLNPTTAAAVTYTNEYQKAVTDYQAAINNNMASLAATQTSMLTAAVTKITPYGWVMAGAFLNAISRFQGDLASAASDTMPTTSPPKVRHDNDGPGNVPVGFSSAAANEWDIRGLVARDMENFDRYEQASAGATDTTADTAGCAAMVGVGPDQSTGDIEGTTLGVMDKAFKALEIAAREAGVWTGGDGTYCTDGAVGGTTGSAKTFNVGIRIGGRDPFAQMAALGFANLKLSFELFAGGAAAQAVGGAISGWSDGEKIRLTEQMGGAGLSGLGSMAVFLAVMFWTTGFTLAFILPLMPFMRFFFAVMSWVGAVIEAVIAVPLVALAHLNPEGEGLPSASAKGAYFFVFNLFLRPILCVFGLIAGLTLFMIAVSYLNFGYEVAVSGTGASVHAGFSTLSKIIYSILYVCILYIICNHCFMMIDHLPEHALRWMGASGQSMQKMGDAEKIEGYGTAISGYVGQQAMFNGAKAAQGIGKSIGSGMKAGVNAGKFDMKSGVTQGRISKLTEIARNEGKNPSQMVNDRAIMGKVGLDPAKMSTADKDLLAQSITEGKY